jgi:ribosomal protein S18 acetylase RimI-like enzyme
VHNVSPQTTDHLLMSTHISFRTASLADVQNLAALTIQVWLHTYAKDGIRHDISAYVLGEFTPKKFAALINNPQYRLLIAENKGHLIAYAMLDLAASNADFPSAELKTFYVQEAFTGQGIGKQLLAYVERNLNQQAYWLSVNSNNTRAIAFYAHQAFVQHGVTYFEFGGNQYENKVLVKHPKAIDIKHM